MKLSLHTPFDEERKYLMPVMTKKYDIESILKEFQILADELGTKLICSYVLFSFPNGGNNYSIKHAKRITEIVDSKIVKVTLGVYSDTGKGFVSPEEKEYKLFYHFLNNMNRIETEIIKLYGQDINAACGMLHFSEEKM